MQFEHEGLLVTHPRLYRAFLRGVRHLPEEDVFVVQLGHFRGEIDVEDCPWLVTVYDAQSGEIQLSDGSREPLRIETLRADPDDALRCTVKERFPARFTHAAQALLLDAVDWADEGPRLRAGPRRVLLPQPLG